MVHEIYCYEIIKWELPHRLNYDVTGIEIYLNKIEY